MKLTGAALFVSRGVAVLRAAPAAYPYRSAAVEARVKRVKTLRRVGLLALVPPGVERLVQDHPEPPASSGWVRNAPTIADAARRADALGVRLSRCSDRACYNSG